MRLLFVRWSKIAFHLTVAALLRSSDDFLAVVLEMALLLRGLLEVRRADALRVVLI